MGRDYGYINISKPRILSPGLSHDLQLHRDLEIVNARTVAELGPLPPDGLPIVPKSKYIPPQSAAISAQAQANFEKQEENAMNLSQLVTVTALATGIAACEPSSETGALPSTLIAPTPDLETSAIATEASSQPKETTVIEPATASIPAIPDEIRAFVPPDSTLLAYKRFDLTGDGNEDAALIVRHPIAEGSRPDFSKNPCDLIILHREGRSFKLAGKSSKAIDCTYKVFARERAYKADDLNDSIELKPQEIICTEERDKPTGISTVYSFKYSRKRSAWYLNEAEATYVSYDAIGGTGRGYFANEKVKYPDDIGFIEIDSFNPRELSEAYEKNKKIEFFEEENKETEE